MTGKLPPIWLMGFFGNLPIGVFGAVTLMTLPQLLSADHVPETAIAAITAISIVPGFSTFVLAPILDWRFSRRVYAALFLIAAAILQFAGLMARHDTGLLTWVMFAGSTAVQLNLSAMGGWFGALVPTGRKNEMGAWFAIASIAGFGITAILAIALLRDLPYALGAALLSLLLLSPLGLYVFVPAPPADGRLAGESFRQFFGEVLALLRQREILWTLLLFAMPAASFALTNMLGGVGRDFGASEQMVSIVAGVGVTLAGIIGSLVVPQSLRFIGPRRLYILIGGSGALFSLCLIFLKPSPAVFTLALLGENLFQAAAFAVQYAIILRSIGEDNPFAATQYSLIGAATMLPLAYMQALDGQGYGLGGLKGAYLTDGGIAFAASVILALLFWQRGRRAVAAVA